MSSFCETSIIVILITLTSKEATTTNVIKHHVMVIWPGFFSYPYSNRDLLLPTHHSPSSRPPSALPLPFLHCAPSRGARPPWVTWPWPWPMELVQWSAGVDCGMTTTSGAPCTRSGRCRRCDAAAEVCGGEKHTKLGRFTEVCGGEKDTKLGRFTKSGCCLSIKQSVCLSVCCYPCMPLWVDPDEILQVDPGGPYNGHGAEKYFHSLEVEIVQRNLCRQFNVDYS